MSRLADAYTVTSYQELREKWPVPEWRLAVNPGFPIDAYSSIESVAAAAAGEEPVPTAAELIVDGIAEDPQRPVALDPHELLTEAAERADVDGYVDALLDADVVVPTTREVTDPEDLTGPEAPWYRAGPTGAAGDRGVHLGGGVRAGPPRPPRVIVPFVALLMMWPEGHGLSVNPGDRDQHRGAAPRRSTRCCCGPTRACPTPRPSPLRGRGHERGRWRAGAAVAAAVCAAAVRGGGVAWSAAPAAVRPVGRTARPR